MKKTLSVVFATILLTLSLSFAACSSNDDWAEVQSITYGSTTLTSTYEFNVQRKNISKDEYDPSLGNNITLDSVGEIPKNRTDFFEILSENINKVEHSRYFQDDYGNFSYDPMDGFTEYIRETTYTDYVIYYVSVKFFDDGSIGLKYYEDGELITKRILPTSYQITYFSE